MGYDAQSVVVAALDKAITQALSGIPIDLGSVPVLGPILSNAGITNAAALLKLLGFALPGGATPGGVSIITAGPPFTLLKSLGVDLGWTPGFPDSIADEMNGTTAGDTGIVVGAANLIPIKVDGTVEYDPLSDVPAWPNPVTLANSAAALAFRRTSCAA